VKKKTDFTEIGYTHKQLEEVIPKNLMKEFDKWMYGQTGAINDEGELIYYKWDVEKFLYLRRTGRKETVGEWD
jgi:hypothetical protein